MAQQLFLNNFDTSFIAAVKDTPVTGTPATELDYGILRISDGAAGTLLNPTGGDYYLLTAFKRSGTAETNIEIMRVTAVDNSVPGECRITVLRGQEGTPTRAYVGSDYLSLRWTKGAAQTMVQTTDTRLTDPRTPTGGAGGVLSGTYPNPGFAVDMATQAELDAVAAAKANTTHTHIIGDVTGLQGALDSKQATLVPGTTIKTINGLSLLGSGDVAALSDAPSDGKTYGRKDAAWVEAGGPPVIRTPINTAPAAAATGVMDGATLSASAYYSLYSIPMAASQWQVSVGMDFATTVVSTGDVAGTGTTYALAGGLLSVSTVYYWRVRYKDTEGMYSDWSLPTSFTTAASFNDYIATPTATPSDFGDPMEGGFYAGLIWNELVQTATSSAIGTGTKVFAVPSMTGAPIVYAGQQLEVRSRANPANKMAGTVTGATGTVLTLSITSVGGSGTFTDWSIMSRYRVIVAPKASGENAAIAWKNANDAGPVATGTLTEGRKATLAMVAAGTSTVYPAAHWCNNLSISGKTDWYLPARDELELCWRNLKPTATANYTSADRPASATPNYQNLGSYGDTEATHGLNKNSSPVGAAYTSGTPAQVAAGKNFRTGESEAFAYGSFFYWSASEYSATSAWNQYWHSSVPGNQYNSGKADAFYVRAVRRSII